MTRAGEHFKSFMSEQQQTLRAGNIYSAIKSGRKLSSSTERTAIIQIKSKLVDKPSEQKPVIEKKAETEKMFLVQFTDGTVDYVPKDLRGRDDIMGILKFPTDINDLYRIIRTTDSNRRDYEYSDDLESSNYVAEMPNLEFSVAIPEGYKNISYIFSKCPKFNCTVIVPASVRKIAGILEGTPAFSKSVLYKGKTSRLDTTVFEHGVIEELS